MKQYTKFLAGVLVVAVLAVTVNFSALTANAASLSSLSDVMTDQTTSATSDHTILFTVATGLTGADTADVPDGASIAVTFAAGFDLTGVTINDDVTVEGDTAGALTVDDTDCSAADVVVGIAAQVVTVELCTGADIAADEAVTIGIANVVNPGSAGSYTISIETLDDAAETVDSGSLAVPIIDDGTVDVTATVDPTITFELWTETEDCTSGRTNDTGDQSVALGSLPTSGDNVASSGSTGVAFVCLDLASNASGGAVIKVASANGELTGDTGGAIESASAAVTAGTENYGVCVSSTGTVTQGDSAAAAAPYNGTCNETGVADSGDSTVGALGLTAANIFTINSDLTTNVIAVDEITVVVKAAASGTTPAGSYTDTLTFTATATF